MNKKRLLFSVLSVILCVAVCVTVFLKLGNGNAKIIKLTHPEVKLSKGTEWKVEGFAAEIGTYSSAEDRLSKMTLVASDSKGELYFDTATCDIAYKTANGLYFSTPWDLKADDKSVETQRLKIASQLRLSFMNSQQKVSEIFSFQDCISKGQYTLERLENGVQVNMIIGRAEQRTLLPAALTAESFEDVRDSLSGRPKTRIKAFYKLYDPKTTPESQIEAIAENIRLQRKRLYMCSKMLPIRKRASLRVILRMQATPSRIWKQILRRWEQAK